ncbi:glycoside hydrolase family 32 protein [Paludisphaera sp.]|uniref:glycoside hydrolase family 32 protein n=1 Tax=Paludisphaera sp. TaxID=2017432 RepID=UPI00301BA338
MLATLVLVGSLAVATTAQDAARPDVLVADFEGDDYGGWKATGDAFGEAPARGTLPGQMPVEGYLGRGLVNSFRGGDDSTGELTSPPFKIERSHLNFLIGGGGWAGETCLDLLVDGRVVLTATGPNREPGGSERLRWLNWDVSDLQGKEATLRVVDRRKGGWGHVNVDHIVQTDAPRLARAASRSIVLEKRFLHIPVKTGATKHRARIVDEDWATLHEFEDWATLHEFDVELSAEPDFLAFVDLDAHRGKTLAFAVEELDDLKALEKLVQSDDVPDAASLYKESHRPQFHFTSRRGWLNDPNGLVWRDGEYHLFYQHNPYGWGWGNMHWGHAVSPDLVHWTELPIAIYPREYGDWAFSGSAVVDHGNTSGFGKDGQDPLVAAYTSTGRGECIVYSNDRGRTWTEFDGNPVVKHDGRDPRLFWHAPGKHWVMAVYSEGKDRQSIDFYTSPDLKAWTFASRSDGYYECPDIYELPVDGDPDNKLWVLSAADGQYRIGTFDGKAFTPTSGADKLTTFHGNYYAAQTYSDEPKGRRVQVGWGRGVEFPGSAFNQQMALPVELTLRTTEDGPRLFAEPVEELKSLRTGSRELGGETLEPGADNPLAGESGDLFEIEAEFRPGSAKFLEFNLRGTPLIYDVERQDVVCKQVRTFVPQVDGVVRLQVFVDRGSVEVFANRGRTMISVAAIPGDEDRSLGVAAEGGPVELEKLTVHALKSTWTSEPR